MKVCKDVAVVVYESRIRNDTIKVAMKSFVVIRCVSSSYGSLRDDKVGKKFNSIKYFQTVAIGLLDFLTASKY